jgi:hypothetical protein
MLILNLNCVFWTGLSAFPGSQIRRGVLDLMAVMLVLIMRIRPLVPSTSHLRQAIRQVNRCRTQQLPVTTTYDVANVCSARCI